jgi:hypothetical protein
MYNWRFVYRCVCATAAALLTTTPMAAHAADIFVPAGGNLQAALDAAEAGDTILLQPGATYTGNFRLPVHGGSDYVTIRTAGNDAELPPAGARITPAHAPYLAKIKSPNTSAALRTATAAAYWRLMFLEFHANVKGYSDIVQIGDGSTAQSQLSQVPQHFVVDRVYMRGDALHGQKRGIAINGGDITIVNSWIADIKAIGQDSQAIGGWNGTGPFRIENNYLEGAGEVFMLGGDDPKIPNMTPQDLVFRGNMLTKPLSWRSPIVATPSGVRATVADGGSLAAGTYAYRVVARRPASNTTAKSPASTEVSVTAGGGSRVTLEWDAVADATEYLVYGRTPGAQNWYRVVTSTTMTDDGAATGSAGTPSSSGTVWSVKNIFELKHVRRALISYNVMENNWAQAQQGIGILITPRNQNGGCLWCVVEDVTFEYNTVRHAGGGLKILGWDDEQPSQQTKNVIIRHNEFSDISKAWGGTAYVFTIIDGPKNVTIDHNTLISPSGGGVLQVDYAPAEQFTFTNNVARHNTYGIQGGGKGFGNTAIAYYFPGGVVARNVFAGGSASKYPAGNEFPALADFESHFADYAGSDFSLVPGTNWAQTGTDGLDLGADVAAIAAQSELAPPRVTTTAVPATTEFVAYAETLGVEGGRAPYRWSLSNGTLPPGLSLGEDTGAISGMTTLFGDAAFTVQVLDAVGAVAAQPLTIHVERAVPPVEILTQGIADAIATVPYAQAFNAAGGLGTYVWSVTAGTLPAGVSLTPTGVLEGIPTTVGISTFTVTAVDAADQTRLAERAFTVFVVAPPNQPPSISMTAPADGAVVALGATITLAAQPADADGAIQRVDFLLGTTPIGSAFAPAFTLPYVVAVSGSHAFTAVVVDDGGAATSSTPVTVTTRSEIVIHASQVAQMAGNYALVADATAAGGYRLQNPNLGAAKVNVAAAAPASYAEFTFYAEAGRPYQLWMRGKALWNDYANDSVHVQFSAVAGALIGTTTSLTMNLEDGTSAGVAGWGWQDHGYGIGVLGAPIMFTETGLQTVRIQPREDGLSIDQIVLSPEQFLTTSPGTLKDDGTLLPQ